jgi:electron transfer flavoprotein alpha/beta subunit
MRIAVCVAAVPNPDKVKWDRFRSLLDVQEAEPVLNPVDRHALELASALAKQTGSTFTAICAGAGASAALREAAAFGAERLIAIADDALETADEAGIAAALAAAIGHIGGAVVVFCGASTASLGSGAVPGYLSARLESGLSVDALGTDIVEDALWITMLGGDGLWKARAAFPTVVTAAPYGIKVRAISPILLMKSAKKASESVTLADIGCQVPLPSTGADEGPLESNRGKKGMEVVDGDEAAARAITVIAALRERLAV